MYKSYERRVCYENSGQCGVGGKCYQSYQVQCENVD